MDQLYFDIKQYILSFLPYNDQLNLILCCKGLNLCKSYRHNIYHLDKKMTNNYLTKIIIAKFLSSHSFYLKGYKEELNLNYYLKIGSDKIQYLNAQVDFFKNIMPINVITLKFKIKYKYDDLFIIINKRR